MMNFKMGNTIEFFLKKYYDNELITNEVYINKYPIRILIIIY